MSDPHPISTLVTLVARLRDPEGGCPWDQAQTHQSLIPYLLEEAHELADALRQGDDIALADELGDLLLQVVLHAQLAQERQAFDLASVAATISAKLVRRHPHVFGGEQRSWEEIKRQEQATRGEELSLADELRRKLRGQGALAGAMAISKKAAAAGFEWNNIDGVWAKVHEELDELKQALAAAETTGDRSHAQTELGDLLFTLVNVARWCQLDPEEGLAGTNQRFLERFGRVEAALAGDLSGRPLEELEALWQQAKAEIRAEQGS
ncbi:MAG: nucleoside triphosphate pyrophosphohydrolase [Synechococcus lacustris]